MDLLNTRSLIACALAVTMVSGCGALSSLNKSDSSLSASSIEAADIGVPYDETTANMQVVDLSPSQISEVDGLVAGGLTAFSQGDTNIAVRCMADALAKDPYNATANFAMAVNDVNQISKNKALLDAINTLLATVQSDVYFNGFMTGNTVPSPIPWSEMDSVTRFLSVTVAPTFNQNINAVVSAFIPNLSLLDSAITRLQIAAAMNTTFNLNFNNPGPQSDAHSVVVSRDDVLTIYFYLNLVRAIVNQHLAYDYRFREGTYASFEELLNQNPNFLTLAPDGALRMKKAGRSYRNCVCVFKEMLSRIPMIPADQIFIVDDLLQSLSGTAVSVTGRKAPYTVTRVCLSNWFDNPVADLRRFRGFTITSNVTEASFPPHFDYTLNGVFPDIHTFDDLKNVYLSNSK